ncbi:MAG: thioesterase family protein [Chloroflexi bacterium]|nr:thioesterase family protein [Chloroflexota bacterium]
MNLSDLPVTAQAVIPTEYLDFLDHMNVMWYTHLFDLATWGFYDLFGFGEDYHRRSGCGSFALESHVRHLAEVRAGDGVKVYSRALARSEKVLHAMHFMAKTDGALAATLEYVGVHIDMGTRRSSPLPPEVAAGYDRLLAGHAALGWEPPVCGAMGVGKKSAG